MYYYNSYVTPIKKNSNWEPKVLQLSYHTKEQQGDSQLLWTVKHSYEVSSIPFEIFAEIWGNKGGDQVQNVSQYIYRWLRRYDGTIESLREKSRRPHHHPNQHTEQELKLIRNMRRRNPSAGLVVFRVKLRQREYTRTVTGLYRVLRRNGEMAVKPKNPKYIPIP